MSACVAALLGNLEAQLLVHHIKAPTVCVSASETGNKANSTQQIGPPAGLGDHLPDKLLSARAIFIGAYHYATDHYTFLQSDYFV